jgi:hypothetical protein
VTRSRRAITGDRKTVHPHKVIAGSRWQQMLFDFIDNNPTFEFHRTAYCNDPFLDAERAYGGDHLAISGLTGRCVPTAGFLRPADWRAGGFPRGARQGRLPIITLPSTAKDGAVSRIVPTLRPGAGV